MSTTYGSQNTLFELAIAGKAPVALYTGSFGVTGSTGIYALTENLKIKVVTKMDGNLVINSDIPIWVQGGFMGGNLSCDMMFSSDTPIMSFATTGSNGILPNVTLVWALAPISGSGKTLTANLIAFNEIDLDASKDSYIKASVKGSLLNRPTWQ